MHVQLTLYIIPLLLAATLSGVLTLYAWRHRTAEGARGFMAITAAITVWVATYALEIAGADLATKIFFAKIQYFAIVSVPVAWLVFALQFSQRQRWLTRQTCALLLVIPAATCLLALSNEAHGLIWSATWINPNGPFPILEVNHGGWFWVHLGYSYLLILLGTVLIGIAVLRMPQIYRRQAWAVLAAGVFPWIGNALYLAGLNPIPQLDLTPFTFTLTSIMLAWGIFGFRLLDLAPVAREAVLEAMHDGVLTLDTQNRVVDMNPAAARMLGIAAGRALGRSAADIVGPQLDLIRQKPSDAESQTELIIGAGAAQRNIRLRMSQIEDRHARPLGRLIILRDVTEERMLDRLRDDLTHTMVHDLRNPLTSMLGALDVLHMLYTPQGDGFQLLQIAVRSSNRMLNLVNAILDVSRLESGQMSLSCAWRSLGSLVQEVFDQQAPLANEKRLQLISALPPLPPVWVDEDLVRRVFQNLVDNAIKFTPAGGTITVAAHAQENPSQIVVSVGDTGPGIPNNLRGRLFEKFVTGTDMEVGSGLGLAFCRLTIEAHGGTIWLDDTSAQGALFKFSLPAVQTFRGALAEQLDPVAIA